MTGYTVHTGSTEKFSENYDKIFGGGKSVKKKKAKNKSAKPTKSAKKKPAGKKK